MKLEVKHCSVSIQGKPIVQDVSFSLNDNTTLSIIGPSGAGKTTLLRCIAGLQEHSGTIAFFNHQPTIGYVDQQLNLFPHYTAWENIAYPLHIRKVPKLEIKRRVETIMNDFGITHTAERYPQQLSGGEQQRVALARTFIYNPNLLLLDEPFGSLDALRRFDIIQWFINYQQAHPRPTLFITHDIREAQAIAPEAVVLIAGQVAARGTWAALGESTKPQVVDILRKVL